MPALYTWRYTVVGDGRFPADMLRYDQAWIDPADALLALRQELTGDDPNYRPHRSVDVIGHQEPTVGRWASFGWKVEDVKKTQGRVPCPYPADSTGVPDRGA